MSGLNVKKRDGALKGKQLRSRGIIPAVIYGKNLDNSISIQLDAAEADKFIKTHGIGSQLDLAVDGETYSVMFKNFTLTPLKNKLEHVDFQALTAGEAVKLHVHLKFENKDSVEVGGIVNEMISEIEIECLPKYLLEHVDVDLADMKIGDSIAIKDLAIAGDENYHILTDPETVIVQVTAPVEVSDEEEESPAGEEASAEVPVIGAEE